MTASRETEVSQLARELRDAREQLTTTSEILEVIRNSLNDTQPVFDAIVQSGVRLFPGAAVSIALVENGMVQGSCRRGAQSCARRIVAEAFPLSTHARIHAQRRDPRPQNVGYSRRRERAPGDGGGPEEFSRERLSGRNLHAADARRESNWRAQRSTRQSRIIVGEAA